MDQEAIERLRRDNQEFFVPYYEEVVANHPGGISAVAAKRMVRQLIQERYGFNPFDAELFGFNPRTDAAYTSQLANNLISNYVLDRNITMTVVRHPRPVTLYPLVVMGTTDGLVAGGRHIPEQIVELAGNREPQRGEATQASVFLRSPALAEYVR